ncbi:MAG: response regulator transcription factor [Gemmatimonadales bacterium]|nr:response regulator transcription factor [Gemmatimonadales bacterium]
MKIRTLVVEDEPIARRSLCSMVSSVEWMSLTGQAEDGAAAAKLIDEGEPDLVFLDIRLPRMSGIEVLERVTHRPEVVFTTAYDEYAIRALQLGALDYLLKPFGRKRFLEAVDRVRERLRESGGGLGILDRARNALRETGPMRRLYVRDRALVVPIDLDVVERIEARGDYAVIHAEKRDYFLSIGLGELEPILDPQRFIRLHRSYIVNLDYVASFRPHDERRFAVTMKDGFEVTASRTGTRLLRRLVL